MPVIKIDGKTYGVKPSTVDAVEGLIEKIRNLLTSYYLNIDNPRTRRFALDELADILYMQRELPAIVTQILEPVGDPGNLAESDTDGAPTYESIFKELKGQMPPGLVLYEPVNGEAVEYVPDDPA